jgi:CheY-like chemotaxis protein
MDRRLDERRRNELASITAFSSFFAAGNYIMKTVLLVDDDNTVLLGTGVRLKSMGYTVYTAKDAVSAVSAVTKVAPDVVVLDISLPAGDGFTVADRLQSLVGSAATPIIFITASVNPALREQAKKMGASGFLEKPFDATQLADAIEMALSPGDNWQPTLGRVVSS